MARYAKKATTGEKVRGQLLAFVVRTADNWGTGVVRTRHDGGDVQITGKVLGAKVGDTVELEGSYETHARFGVQFKVRACEVVVPQDASGVIGWLASKLPHVSSRRAEALVERHGVEGVWAVLDGGDLSALTAVDGITAERAAEIVAAYRAEKSDRDRIVRLKTWGLTDGQIARVIDEWGDDAEARLRENPYELIEKVDGFGWKRADEIAQRMGVAKDSPARLAACLVHLMGTAVQLGNCYVPAPKLVALSAKECGVEERAAWSALDHVLGKGDLVKRDGKLYAPKVALAEAKLANRFAERVRRASAGGM